MLANQQLQALLQRAYQTGLSLIDLQLAGARFGLTPAQLLNKLAIALAEGFHSRALSYEHCDGAINGLANAIFDLGTQGDFPEPALSLYHAFDDGEWHRRNDAPDLDPAEQYTRPQVEEILRGLKPQ